MRFNLDKFIDFTLSAAGKMSVVAAILFLFPYVFLGLLFASGCATTYAESFPSPNGRLRAVLYERNCGAMDPYITHVSILTRNEHKPDDGWVVLAVRADAADTLLGAWGGPLVTVRWNGDKELILGRHPSIDMRGSKTSVRGVRIVYSDDLTEARGTIMDLD